MNTFREKGEGAVLRKDIVLTAPSPSYSPGALRPGAPCLRWELVFPGAQGPETESRAGRGCLAKVCPKLAQLKLCVAVHQMLLNHLSPFDPFLLPLGGLLSQSKKTIAN